MREALQGALKDTLGGHARLLLLSLPLVVIVVVGALAPWLAPYSPRSTDLLASVQPPSGDHWLGTDQLGRDQFSRLVHAARNSMAVTAAVISIAFVVGVIIGATGAFFGGIVDRLITWTVETMLSVPALLLALAVLGIRGNSIPNLILALSLLAWAPYARIARGAVLSFRGSAAADALRGLGAHPLRILLLHVAPTAARPALVFASTDIGAVVLATASLSFLGLGIPPPIPEWGQMLVESRPYLATAWWLWLPPGLAITFVAFSSNLISEHLGIPPELRRFRVRTARAEATAPSRRAAGAEAPLPEAPLPEVPLVRARDLRIAFDTPHGTVTATQGLDYDLRPGEVLALVGESGSGKTASVLGPLGLLGDTARVRGSVRFAGTELIGASESHLRSVRGSGIAVVFQDPYRALNPLRTVGSVVTEALPPGTPPADARDRVIELLTAVGLPRAETLVDRYPHELSGGMRQRVLIAAALASDPAVLVADEATTALDVTVQAEVLGLLHRLSRERGLGVILISHDLAVVADVADRVVVMYDGRAVEVVPVDRLVREAVHPYTRGLLGAVPVIGRPPGTRFSTLPDPEPGVGTGGCPFAPRCTIREESCLSGPIALEVAGAGQLVACPPGLAQREHAPQGACR